MRRESESGPKVPCLRMLLDKQVFLGAILGGKVLLVVGLKYRVFLLGDVVRDGEPRPVVEMELWAGRTHANFS